MRGTDAYLLARICGNSVATIMQTYERIDIRKRTKAMSAILGASEGFFIPDKICERFIFYGWD